MAHSDIEYGSCHYFTAMVNGHYLLLVPVPQEVPVRRLRFPALRVMGLPHLAYCTSLFVFLL
jgi:hypothetical protein